MTGSKFFSEDFLKFSYRKNNSKFNQIVMQHMTFCLSDQVRMTVAKSKNLPFWLNDKSKLRKSLQFHYF